jgi:hypothetical protein
LFQPPAPLLRNGQVVQKWTALYTCFVLWL